MKLNLNRRDFLKTGSAVLAGLGLGSCELIFGKAPLFSISLAEWSLHRTIGSGEMTNLDFAQVTRERYGLDGIEYVNSFFKDKAKDTAYLDDLNRRAADHGVKQLLIMIDGEGALGDPDEKARIRTVENHKKWIDAAAHLGCHSIRVNAASKGTDEEQMKLCADGAHRLVAYADQHDMDVIVENHGGNSSNGQWLAGLMRMVGSPRFGTLPDFGNFWDYDRYQGAIDLMPFAKAVSAKSRTFDAAGNETETDFFRMVKIVLDAGYHGYLGIEYEGRDLTEDAGILATKALLEKVRTQLSLNA